MKPIKMIFSGMLLTALLCCTAPALAEESVIPPADSTLAEESAIVPDNDAITVLVDGTPVVSDVPAQLINDRAMLPFRAILEPLGADVDWNKDYQIVTAVKGMTILNLRIGKPIMVRINLTAEEPEQISLDVPPQIIQDRTLVPVRAIAEALEAEVGWDQETLTVTIHTQEDQ